MTPENREAIDKFRTEVDEKLRTFAYVLEQPDKTQKSAFLAGMIQATSDEKNRLLSPEDRTRKMIAISEALADLDEQFRPALQMIYKMIEL